MVVLYAVGCGLISLCLFVILIWISLLIVVGICAPDIIAAITPAAPTQ